MIDDAVPPDTLTFAAESSLSLLSEEHARRLGEANFKLMLPGIESWYSFGNKAKTGRKTGAEKMEQVSDHVNMLLEHIPYVQTNFVLGLDDDEGPEPFELTKKFLRRTPGAFPGYSLLSCFGEAAPLNIDLQNSGRVRPFPFHFLNNNHAMNVAPKNYEWTTFYDHLIDLCEYSFSLPSMFHRFRATPAFFAKGLNVVRTISSEGYGRIKYHKTIRRMLGNNEHIQRFFAGRDGRSAPVLRGPGQEGARALLGSPARWRDEPRPERLREEGRESRVAPGGRPGGRGGGLRSGAPPTPPALRPTCESPRPVKQGTSGPRPDCSGP